MSTYRYHTYPQSFDAFQASERIADGPHPEVRSGKRWKATVGSSSSNTDSSKVQGASLPIVFSKRTRSTLQMVCEFSRSAGHSSVTEAFPILPRKANSDRARKRERTRMKFASSPHRERVVRSRSLALVRE